MATATLAMAFSANAQLTWASRDGQYNRKSPLPTQIVTDTTLNAWRGERISALALLNADADMLATASLKGNLKGEAHFNDFVLTNNYQSCGTPPADLETWEVADIIDSTTSAANLAAGETRPVWVTIEVPRNTKPGTYTNTLTVDGRQLTLHINVQDKTLPKPTEDNFYLDLWQQPYSVSRYHNVEPWSKEHFALLEPYAKMLARAGQNNISAILFFEPWGAQSNDLFLPMVNTVRKTDGTWNYDYTIFDRWVEFMTKHGVGPDIECFTMIPWDMSFRYFDEATNDYAFLKTTTGAKEYADLWSSFLKSFLKHVDKKGWTERVVIMMDERSSEDMANAIRVVNSVSPQLKVSLAGNYHPEIIDRLYACSLNWGQPYPPGKVAERRANGQISAIYTCCGSPKPNLFTNNMLADAAWLPLYVKTTGHDGYLHWSWMNWTDDPLHDSRFKFFAPGDTYFIYPEGRSSVRFERLIEGIQLSEKARILREKFIADGNTQALDELNSAFIPIAAGWNDNHSSTALQVANATTTIDHLSTIK